MRQLDSALAGGDLSANEYRKRRDEILAAASSAQPPSPVIGPPTGPQPVVAEGAEAHDAAEVTQVVSIENGESEADVTQIITDPAKSNGTEHTQIVAPVTDAPTTPAPPEQPQAQQNQQGQPPQWATLPPTHTAATGIASFPPVPPQVGGPAVTPLDAQDLFTSNKPARGGPKPLLIVVAVVVVLAIAGGAVWFLGFRDSDDTNTAGQETSQDNGPKAPEPVDITKIELPGEAADNAGTMDIGRASELQVIAPSEATLLADAGAKQVTYSGYSDENYRYLLYAYKSDSAAAAKELTGKILDVQKGLGFTDTKVEGVPGDVTMTTVSNRDAAALRGVYTYGDTTIQLSVLQIPVGDIAELHAQFQQAMTAVTDAAPPTK
ncbi:hypothetical protein [Actinophytocola oryzae]|uniref:hypothetical protein n=1 Tax=Actinophytocola oryzae TaxID=502181 RepID=UPI0010635FCD|nr:hypothetical protein [Actinophytocola oryzae]